MKKYVKAIILFVLIVFSKYAYANILPINDSTITILKESFKTDQNNTVISGLSLDYAMAMLANGAQGQSLKDLTDFFNASVEDKNEELQEKAQYLPETLEISNSIWGNEFKKPYKELIEKTFGASVNPLPDNTKVINKWIEEKTHGKISKLFEPKRTSPSDLFLVNTIFFKDDWEYPFSKDDTERKIFHSLSGEDVKVPMMYKQFKVLYAQNDKLQSVQLPYKNNGSLIIFLPKQKIDFNKFISNLSLEDLNLNYEFEDVQLTLPKFKIEQETDVKELFKAMGIKVMFAPTFDFDDMSMMKGVFVDMITQKAIVEVDESGTVATAVTVVGKKWGNAGHKPKLPIRFVADRPFLFFITQGDFIGLYTTGISE